MSETIYGIYEEDLKKEESIVLGTIEEIRKDMEERTGMDPVEHCLSRIKSDSSMREKLVRKGLEVNTENALHAVHDAIGIRVVCPFVNDVYAIARALEEKYELVEEKDYIRNVKPNGYRSLHVILRTENGYYAEVQLRTISMDTWAALEHHLKYKKNTGSETALIVSELKRCADELESTDLTMQTIKDMITGEL